MPSPAGGDSPRGANQQGRVTQGRVVTDPGRAAESRMQSRVTQQGSHSGVTQVGVTQDGVNKYFRTLKHQLMKQVAYMFQMIHT